MKKNKILALTVASLMTVSSLGLMTSCKGGGIGGTVVEESTADPNATTLTVATYDGGVGHAWLDEAAARYEAKCKEEGKNVDVVVSYDKDSYGGTTLADKTLDKDVYFTEGIEYYTYVNKDKVADISDVVRGNATGESVTIESKLDASLKSYLTAKDGKYYMLPFYDGFYGFVYDVDLFEEEGFYFDASGDFIARGDGESQTAYDARKSNGPDGVKGNYDDGLPATYAQFIELADRIVERSCIPFCYSGNVTTYVDKAFRSFIADYEGDAMRLNYSLEGQGVKLVKSINSDGSVVLENMDINPSNAYELQRQAGKYYALKMQEELFGSTKYVGGSWNAFSYTEAQQNFIKSKYTSNRYAMLAEGVWWENEATDVFEEMENIHHEKKEDRRFGLLPIPKADPTKAGNQTMLSANNSFCFVNKSTSNLDLAKDFLRFLHTDSEMSKFTAKTSITRSLSYTVSNADRESATYFGKTMIDMRKNAQVVYPYSSVNVVLDHSSNFTDQMWFWTATVDGATVNNVFASLRSGVSATDYFNGLYLYQKNIWETAFKNYFK